MRGRWQIKAALGVGLAVGLLGSLAAGTLRAAGNPGVVVGKQGTIAFVRAQALDHAYALYLRPRNPLGRPVFRLLPPGVTIPVNTRSYIDLEVIEVPSVFKWNFANLDWIDCNPGICGVPPRDLMPTGLAVFSSCGKILNGNEIGDQCFDHEDNDGDCFADLDDPDDCHLVPESGTSTTPGPE